MPDHVALPQGNPQIPGEPGWELQLLLDGYRPVPVPEPSIPGEPGWELQLYSDLSNEVSNANLQSPANRGGNCNLLLPGGRHSHTSTFNPRRTGVGTATVITGNATADILLLQSPANRGGNCN